MASGMASPQALSTAAPPPLVSTTQTRVGRVLSTLAVLFLAMDCVGKVLQLDMYIKGTTDLGFASELVLPLGVLETAVVVLYCIPRTAVLGAVLLTAWLGGAVATHLRLGNPLLSHTLFPIYVGLFVWGGLYLRVTALRLLLPLRTGSAYHVNNHGGV